MTIQGIEQVLHCSPKAELHLHLEGSLSLEFWKSYNNDIYSDILKFKGSKRKSLGSFLQCMKRIHYGLDTPHSYYVGCLDLLDQMIQENIKYVELTWAPGGIYEFHGIEPQETFDSINRAIEEKKEAIDCRLLIDIIRNQGVSVAQKIIQWLSKTKPNRVVGLNFGGDEERFKIDPFKEVFQEARSLKLGVSIHAGESVDEHTMMQAVRIVNPDRVGHGTSLESPLFRSEIIEMGIHIESCPSSNVCLQYLRELSHHPVFRDRSLKASINTDDRTFFSPTLSNELALLHRKGILGIKNIAGLQIQAIKDAFSKTESPFMENVLNFWRPYAFSE